MNPLALRAPIEAALDYVLSRQADDGSWTEWALPPGSSSQWTTAYVGCRLRHLPPRLAATVAPRLRAAGSWLSEHAFANGGWGYNEAVGVDADSTSLAILFLASARVRVSGAAFRVLAGLQGTDGGFSTYAARGEPNSWNVSHPDVTPVALLAMLTDPSPDGRAIRRGVTYVVRQQMSQGLWNSFWWSSCLYGTEASLSLLSAMGIAAPSSASALTQMEPDNPFETALLVLSFHHLGCDTPHGEVEEAVDKLVCQQQPDGGWNSAPILRITRPDCYEPWACGDAGQLYDEPNRLFTTATVLQALTEVSAGLTRGGRG
jgi:Prenyltransferase and squalene oxidase repeat